MSMNNYWFRLAEIAQQMPLDQLYRYEKTLEEQLNSPFDDGDWAGDMATSNLLSLVRERISKLEKQSP
jgi:hypothetical protein